MSFNQIIGIGRSSLQTLTAAMNTTGQNVANANTEGYVRRRITLESRDTTGSMKIPTAFPRATGEGVAINTYDRTRDLLLSTAAWEAQSALGGAQEDQRILGALEGMFPNSDGGSLGAVLNDFWNAWSDLADDPTNHGIQLTVRNRALSVTHTFNRLDGDLLNLKEETDQLVSQGVDKVNGLLEDITSLNRRIREARMQGSPDLSAEDRRDVKIKELSGYMPIRVAEGSHRTYTITVGGMRVVEEDTFTPLRLGPARDTIYFGKSDVALPTSQMNDGKLASWLRNATDTIPTLRAEMDKLAAQLVTNLNDVHTQRLMPDGSVNPGSPFFDPAGLTAATIAVDAGIMSTPQNIGTPGYATPGGEDIVVAVANLRNQALAGLGNETTEHFAINLLSDVGARVHRAAGQVSTQSAIAAHLEAMEQGISKVSIDEEMVDLIRFQQAYGAMGRVLNTAQQMIDTLLSI